jgi:hypothetical protein
MVSSSIVHNVHGDNDEEVDMSLPPGAEQKGDLFVAYIKPYMSGLKQASRNWFAKFSSALRRAGFQQSQADHSFLLFSSSQVSTSSTFIFVYVDDIVITGSYSPAIQEVKTLLHQRFHIQDLWSGRTSWLALSKELVSVSENRLLTFLLLLGSLVLVLLNFLWSQI